MQNIIVEKPYEFIPPYRGLFYWHHVTGLVFGVVTLTWVVSGLVSMNPWGFLDSRGSGEATLIQGDPPKWREVKASLEALRARPELAHVVSLTSALFYGSGVDTVIPARSGRRQVLHILHRMATRPRPVKTAATNLTLNAALWVWSGFSMAGSGTIDQPNGNNSTLTVTFSLA